MIVNVRIDERLIHGQVATMWTNHLKATRIMVVDNEVVKNEMEKEVLKMAKPNSVKLSILTTKGASIRKNNGQYDAEKVFLIVKNPKSIGVTSTDIEAFNYLNQKGVNLVAQMVPNEEKSDFMKLLKEGH